MTAPDITRGIALLDLSVLPQRPRLNGVTGQEQAGIK